MSDFPSSRFERGRIMAGTGLKVGTNYAKYHLRKRFGNHDDNSLSKLHDKNARHIYSEFTKLRGSALKLAQALSLDNSVLPEEFIDVMAQAQYKVPPINKALVRNIINKELGNYPENLFDYFDPEAFAAASLGQVHHAKLKDGRKVAVKIQYPNIRETIASDLGLAKILFRQIKNSENLDSYFKEVKNKLLEETDYLLEGRSIDEYHHRYSHGNFITPEWIKEFSTMKVLTMTFIEGYHMSDMIYNNPGQEERDKFGQLLWDFFHAQINPSRTVHADAHPGNFLFTKEKKLGIIDFGCIKECPSSFFDAFISLVPAHLEKNENMINELYLELEMIRKNPSDPEYEKQFLQFCRSFGELLVKPYRTEFFDFGDPAFGEKLRELAIIAASQPEPRGSKHFVYIARVNLGLFHMLMKLKSKVRTVNAKNSIYDYLKKIPVNYGIT
ncbi:MAG: AarF/ABC1/UbiB kinase family protein [Balneolales bacterium]